jgi:hypothetical protein
MRMLEWDGPNINAYKAVCSFVGNMNQRIMEELTVTIAEHPDTFNSIMGLVNPNYGKWVLEVMREKKIPYDPSYDDKEADLKDILSYPIKHPAFALSLFVGGIFGVAAYAGYELYKQSRKDNEPLALLEFPKQK